MMAVALKQEDFFSKSLKTFEYDEKHTFYWRKETEERRVGDKVGRRVRG